MKVTISVNAKNVGGSPASSYEVLIPPDMEKKLGHLTADSALGKVPLKIQKAPSASANGQSYFIQLPDPVSAGASVNLEIKMYLGRLFTPMPKTVPHFPLNQAQMQKVQFEDSLFFYSPYPTKAQESSLLLPSDSQVERRVPKGESVESEGRVDWGPFTSAKALQRGMPEASKLAVHFGFTRPLSYFKQVTRQIEISHWGAVNFHETYELHNEAAGPAEEFNRVKVGGIRNQVMMRGDIPTHIVFKLESELPRAANNINYFDRIGNISTSRAWRSGSSTKLTLEPRFPVLGGWNADWQLQYSVPTRLALFLSGADSAVHVMNATLGAPVGRLFAENVTTKVVLPAGASDVQIALPREVDEVWHDRMWGWFDVHQSRPVIAWSAKTLYTPLGEELSFQVTYRYSGLAHLQKPLTICFYFLVLFVMYILLSRLDLRILSTSEAAGQAAEDSENAAVSALVDTCEDALHLRDDLFQAADSYGRRPVKRQWDRALKSFRKQSETVKREVGETVASVRDTETGQKILQAVEGLIEASRKAGEARVEVKEKGKGESTAQTENAVSVAEERLLRLVQRAASAAGNGKEE
mmetsp:Transcript_16444/g.33462  ORF Transcript_16444/g.33462 Transcript_16444/m.33462 type:complete len:582 (+) Transcript_16444:435-2180(+)